MGKGNLMQAFRIGAARKAAVEEALKAIERGNPKAAVPTISDFINDAIDRRLKEMERQRTKKRKAVRVAKGYERLTVRRPSPKVLRVDEVERMIEEGGPVPPEDAADVPEEMAGAFSCVPCIREAENNPDGWHCPDCGRAGRRYPIDYTRTDGVAGYVPHEARELVEA